MKLKNIIHRNVATSFHILATVLLLSGCTTDDVDPKVIDDTEPKVAVFDFTSSSAVTSWGLAIPGGSSGTEISSLTQNDVTITATPGTSSNHARIYATGSGVLDLRVYTGDVITVKVPDGYIITAMEWTSQNTSTINDWTVDNGAIADGKWTAPSNGTVNSISLTATGTTRMNILTVSYEKGEATIISEEIPVVVEEDPVNVTMDFTSADEIKSWGYGVPGSSQGIALTGALSKGNLTLTPSNADGATADTSVRLYTSKGGATDLRIYKGDAITLSVKSGYVIKAFSWTSANADTIDAWTVSTGSISGGVWTAEQGSSINSITLTATGTTRINTLSVTYEKTASL